MAVAMASVGGVATVSPWLLGRGRDLTLIILSVALVPVPILLHTVLGLASSTIDVLVAGIIGGPHMYSTLTISFLERRFLVSYPVYAAGALAIPVLVFYLAATNLTLLLTFFMMWASLHVMHQVAFIADCYRVRGGEGLLTAGRGIDYFLLFICMYPFAAYRIVNDDFVMGGDKALHTYFPAFLKTPSLYLAVGAVFVMALTLFALKTYAEWRAGTLNLPKTLLIVAAVSSGFVIPMFANLDVAFEGMNVWHSVQYLGVVWYLNRMRRERGEMTSPIVSWLARDGRGAYFYLFNVLLTIGAGGLVLFLTGVIRLPQEQAYYSVILSFLLIHYYVDHGLFTRARAGAGQTSLWPADSAAAASLGTPRVA